MMMPNRTISRSLSWVSQQLEAAGVEDARREGLILLAAALGVDRTFVMAHPEQLLADRVWKRLTGWTHRRACREPLAYVLGSRWFYGLPFHVTPDVLIPRPETELLVEVFLRWVTLEAKGFRGERRKGSEAKGERVQNSPLTNHESRITIPPLTNPRRYRHGERLHSNCLSEECAWLARHRN